MALVIPAAWIGYILSIPPWQNPDEPTHLEYVLSLAAGDTGTGPRNLSPPLQEIIILSMDCHHFWRYTGWPRPRPLPVVFSEVPFFRFSGADSQIGRKPPLYYMLASLLPRLIPGREITFYLYSLRIVSLLFSLGTVILIFFSARLLFPDEYWFQLSSAALAAFLPQFSVVGTSAGYEPLACLLSAGFIFLLLRFQTRGFTISGLLLTAFCFIAAIMVTYRNFELLPLFFFALAIHLVFPAEGKSRWGVLVSLAAGLILFGIMFTAIIWWAPGAARLIIIKLFKCRQNLRALVGGTERIASFYYPWFHREVFKSFWLKFGWALFTLGPVYYLIMMVASLISSAGVLVFTVRSLLPGSNLSGPARRMFLTLLGATMITLVGYYLYWGTGKIVSAQGRHLFVALPAWAILFNLGFRQLCPKRYRTILYPALIIGIIILNAIALFGYVLPTFAL